MELRDSKDIENVVNEAKNVVNDIYAHINTIDNGNAIIKDIEHSKVSLLMEDGKLVDTDAVLSIEQQAEVNYTVRRMIKLNIMAAADRLAAIGQAACGSCAADEEEIGMIAAENKDKNDKPERTAKGQVVFNKDKIIELLKEGYSAVEIADMYGCCEQTVRNYCKTNKINISTLQVKDSRKLTEKNIDEIKALYTNGPFNLTQTAEELHVTKKQLRAFVEEHHIVKPADR